VKPAVAKRVDGGFWEQIIWDERAYCQGLWFVRDAEQINPIDRGAENSPWNFSCKEGVGCPEMRYFFYLCGNFLKGDI
jgi:hypothetical protein